jgi:carbonic anhydrase
VAISKNMHLFESIIEANHKAVAGDTSAGLHPDEFADDLPIIALTCIDPRLNAFFPNILGIPADQFIWLRNAGNIITSPLSSTMRSLALACAVKGGKEIAVIGHTDCQVAKTTTMQLLEKLKALGVDRSRLPDNLNEFFGMFGSERQNLIKACDFIRQSPLVGPRIPVHGLLADIETGKLDWVVNGYEKLGQPQPQPQAGAALPPLSGFGAIKDFEMGEMKFPGTKIGEWVAAKTDAVEATAKQVVETARQELAKASEELPPKIALPPPIRPTRIVRKR